MTPDLLPSAQAFAAAGCCVIPTKPDGTKAPAVNWKTYQTHHPDPTTIDTWFTRGDYDGFGVVCGTVSGGLEMLELEGRAADLGDQLRQLLVDHQAADLWARLCAGYLEQSPSGGFHWLYRVVDATPRGNTKLARRPSTPDELTVWKAGQQAQVDTETDPDVRARRQAALDKITRGDQVPVVLIETRGEGGYVVVAPSYGRSHPTGQPWRMIAGSPATIPTITGAERDLLHALASTLDAMPVPDPAPVEPLTAGPRPAHDGSLRPGDDYNTRATWDDILIPHGWTRGHRIRGGWAWTRPGKHPRDGFSATTGTSTDGADRLYVFSSSTTFETERPYSKFAAYAHLEHGDDHAAAASALRHAGYGAPLEEARPVLTFSGPPAATTAPPQDPPSTPGGPDPAPTVQVTSSEPTTYSLTDDGNALRLVDTHADTIRYVPQRGLWLRWNGHRWAWDEAETVRELARGISRALPADNDVRRKHRQKSLSNAAITAMVRLARTDHRIVTHIATLDAHPFQLNTPAGVVDLTTGHITPPDPTQLHTRSTNVAPDFTAHAPRWDKFLADTFAGDPDLTVYVQRLLGISLIGEVLEQILPFAHGAGANGKTTLLGVFQRLIGLGESGYAISAPSEILLATRNNDHPATIAQLSGARVVVTSELDDGQQFAEARIKQLTGRDVINARFMHQNPFNFVPSHTLWVLANHRPLVKTGGPAFWRRFREIPFLHTVPTHLQDPHLEDTLVDEEGPAILAWCIRGAADYLTHGLAMPDSVKAATAAYQRDQDSVGRFVEEMCELGQKSLPHMRTKVSTIRSDYEAWCHTEGEVAVSPKAFTMALRTQFDVWSERTGSARYYLGIRPADIDTTTPQWPDTNRHDDPTLRWDQR